jgi:hypothetical protein
MIGGEHAGCGQHDGSEYDGDEHNGNEPKFPKPPNILIFL